MVLHECLHGFVRCQTQALVELCCSAVTLLGTLPEETVVVAKEGGVLHLALVL